MATLAEEDNNIIQNLLYENKSPPFEYGSSKCRPRSFNEAVDFNDLQPPGSPQIFFDESGTVLKFDTAINSVGVPMVNSDVNHLLKSDRTKYEVIK
jgi:hypothetical protein